MTNFELLELAAKAAGYNYSRVWYDDQSGLLVWEPPVNYEIRDWNPLTDDGDALRLSVKLMMHVNVYHTDTRVTADGVFVTQMHDADQHSATRRAIVRAAAEIGRAMQ